MEKSQLITPEEKDILQNAQRVLDNIAARANLLKTHMPREQQLMLPWKIGMNACRVSDVRISIARITTDLEKVEEEF